MSLRVAWLALEPFPNAKGSGTRISELARGLVEAGVELHLVTLAPKSAQAPLPPGLSAVVHHPVRLAEPNYLARALAFRDRVARILMSIRPDVVHFRGVFEGQAALDHASRRGIRAVFEVNGLPSVELPYHYPSVGRSLELLGRLRALESRVLQASDFVLTQSHATADFLRGRGLASSDTPIVIPNGADLGHFGRDRAQTPSQTTSGTPTVLYAGTLAPWQGVAELLMATRRVLRARPIDVVLAGPVRRRWRKQLERMIRRLKIQNAVEVTGALDRRALAQRVEAATLCVAPLRRDPRNKGQGCCPIKLFEYMAAGKPVISTDLPCVREILGPSRAVLTSSPRPSILAEAIVGLLNDPGRASALGDRARHFVEEGATWDHRRAALVDFYETVVRHRPAVVPDIEPVRRLG